MSSISTSSLVAPAVAVYAAVKTIGKNDREKKRRERQLSPGADSPSPTKKGNLKESGLNKHQRAAVAAARAAARAAGAAREGSGEDEGVAMRDSDEESSPTAEGTRETGATGATPELAKMGMQVQRELDKEGRKIESEKKKLNTIPEEFDLS